MREVELLEQSTVDGYVGCPDVDDVIALAATKSPAPMSWDYVLTTPVYQRAQSEAP